MASSSPIFPRPEVHYSDYGFDEEIDFFQALHQARKHGKREARPLEGFRFKLQKPISKGGAAKAKKRGKWWRSALVFWRRIRVTQSAPPSSSTSAAAFPVYYTTEGGSGGGGTGGSWPLTPRRRSVTAASGGLKMPYLCLRDLAAVDFSSSPSPAAPLYLVT